MEYEDHETESDEYADECDQCCSKDVEYPYTTLGYLCTGCRVRCAGKFEDIY